MTIRATSVCAFALFFGLGCAGLDVNRIHAAHGTPSNVAVFFTVDTNDGEPVPGLEATDFRIYEDGQLVSVDESQQTIINPEVASEHYTLLLVDMSRSVTESDQVPLIQAAAIEFSYSLQASQQVAVYAFDGSEEITPIQPFRANAQGITRLSGFRAEDPSTNLNGAVVAATEILDEALAESETPLRFGTIVVFTDGTDRAHRVTEGDALRAVRRTNYDVFAIGVGNEIDEPSLDRLGSSGYVLIEDSALIADAFAAISEQILGYTKRFYLLSYCSPARAGVHRVTVEAVSGELTGETSYDFDAAGFGPRCDPNSPPPFDTEQVNVQRQRPRRGRLRVTASATATAE